ncbi:MAG: ribosome biogenesis GTPase Der [Gammaproteobacteria bacterium]|nr:ribosome biogenesis GTPase Der [Gammaproteobacteria bacterium]
MSGFKPVLALVGRPNVGKSTLFNRLTRSREALVADQPGLTRDRKFGEGKLGPCAYIVIDTGGLSEDKEGVDSLMAAQSWLAVEQADRVLFLVDAKDGLLPDDQKIAQRLRQTGKQVSLVVNKIDGMDMDAALSEFYRLGFEQVYAVAAEHGRGVTSMMNELLHAYATQDEAEQADEVADSGIKVAIIGRPNVGKSTLVNRILGEERVITYDMPGTTRDSIYLPFERDGQRYTLIDTAGVRRRGRINEAIEKFSVIKSLQAIEDANVVVMLVDGQEGVTEQDASLLGFVIETGRALVLAINKWDGLSIDQKDKIRRELDIKLPFVAFARLHFISALHGSGVGDLFASIKQAYRAAMTEIPTPKLTRLLTDLVNANPPPLVRGHRIKLRYAHQGGKNPPIIIIHGNQTGSVPDSYRRYLINAFREHLRLHGTPLRIEFKTGENPFKGKKNKLTPRQMAKRKRMVRHLKKS